MTDIQIINPIEFEGWDERILHLPGVSFFHTAAWAKVLSDTYNYNPTYFTFFENNKLISLLPVMDVNSIFTGHRGISLPFTDFCESIADDSRQFRDLFEHAISHGGKSGWKYIELRGGQHFLSPAVPSQTVLAHLLDLLPDEAKMMANLRDSTRRNIRKAISGDVTTEILDTIEAVKEFYRLNCLTRKEHGLPPQPYRFFRQVHKHIIKKNLGFVALAYYQGKAIAGNIYFHFGTKAVYKYGASDKTWQHLRASNLVMWEAIKWYCQKGYKELHFGRTENHHQGLRQFKMGWGAREETIQYFRYCLNTNSFLKFNDNIDPFYNAIFRKTPIPLLKLLGAAVYGHMA